MPGHPFAAFIPPKEKAQLDIKANGREVALQHANDTRDRNSIMSLDYTYWQRVAHEIETSK